MAYTAIREVNNNLIAILEIRQKEMTAHIVLMLLNLDFFSCSTIALLKRIVQAMTIIEYIISN